MLSIIIPTFNEQENVFKIAKRIKNILPQKSYEIIFVDDSNDETPVLLAQLAESDPHVTFIHRENERGLGTAVVTGFKNSKGNIIAVMDADLQHPPEKLPLMLQAIKSGADIVIPSRFIPGGSDGGLNILRKFVSITARYIGKFLIRKLRPVSDITSGFFMFKKDVINNVNLYPIGWKILIEILVRGNYQKIIEVPYCFQTRSSGYSKMNFREHINYLLHLLHLLKDRPEGRRFLCFSLVGLSGVFVNMFIYWVLVKFNLEVKVAGLVSAFIAMLSNFYLNDRFTWANIRNDIFWIRGVKFIITSLIGIGINVSVLGIFFYKFNFNYLFSNFIGIVAAISWNYTINNIWTWGSPYPNNISVERWR